jgi:hypothetical protein
LAPDLACADDCQAKPSACRNLGGVQAGCGHDDLTGIKKKYIIINLQFSLSARYNSNCLMSNQPMVAMTVPRILLADVSTPLRNCGSQSLNL